MTTLAEQPRGLMAVIVAAAAAVGVLCGVDPKIGIAGAVALGVAALVLADVTLGFYFLAFLAFSDLLRSGNLSLVKVVGLVLVVSWLATVATRRDVPNLLTDRPGLVYVLGFFLAWILLSVAWAENRGEALNAAGRYAQNLFLFPIAFTAIRNRDHALKVIAVLAGTAALTGALAILSPVPNPSAIGDTARATGTIGDANELAADLVAGLFLAVALALDRRSPRVVRIGAALAIPLCLGGIVLSLSRGGLIALVAASAAAVLLSGRWRAKAATAGAVVLAATLFYFSFLASLPARERVTQVGTGTGRVDLWTVGSRMVSDHPFKGIGAGNFPVSSVHYLLQPGAITRADFIITTPKVAHNTYLQVLAELGVVGLIAFLAIIGISLACMLASARTAAAAGDEQLELLSRGLLVGTIGALVAGMFISSNYSKLLWLLLALGPALAAVSRGQAARSAASRPSLST